MVDSDDFGQSVFAVIRSIGIWLRIGIIFIPGYGERYSFDWWTLYMALISQVTEMYTFVLNVHAILLASKAQLCVILHNSFICAFVNW